MDNAQTDYLKGEQPPIAVASQDFTLEETAQLQADAFRQAAGTDIGMVSLGGYHDGVENSSGVCGNLFKGNITEDIVNIILPANFKDPICILTLSGKDIKTLLETGFVPSEGTEGFAYIPAGLTVTKNTDGTIAHITKEDGAILDESIRYTVAIDKGAFTDEIGKTGSVQESTLKVNEVLKIYLSAKSQVSPLEHSINTK